MDKVKKKSLKKSFAIGARQTQILDSRGGGGGGVEMNFFYSLSFFPTMGLGLVSKDFAYLTLRLLFLSFV